MNSYIKCLIVTQVALLAIARDGRAQSPAVEQPGFKTVVAGKQYKRSAVYQWLWGKNRRREWTVPVTVPVVLLDTVFGGLIPYQKGGGNESKSLRLRSTTGKEFVLRSVDKSRKDVIPRLFGIPFFGGIIQDGVSMSHPYGAVALPVMLDHTGIPHARPRLVFIRQQPALDTFNTRFADDLYFLEERPDGDWSDQQHLGHSQKFISTLKLLQKLQQDNTCQADQHTFIKARLFDILISDWDRHHDNWRWGETEGSENKYFPVPRDRDQAFFTRDGILTKILIPVTRVRFMHNFDYNIKNVKTLTSQDRKLDRLFTNAMSQNDWIDAAELLRRSITDSVIEQSIRQLPPEIFNLSGTELIEKLKVRRNNLERYASQYYRVVAKKVEINGSEKKEYFEVKRLGKDQVSVNVFRVDSSGQKESAPWYRRIFYEADTKTISIYGFGGQDVFDIDNNTHGIKIVKHEGKSKNPLFEQAESE